MALKRAAGEEGKEDAPKKVRKFAVKSQMAIYMHILIDVKLK